MPPDRTPGLALVAALTLLGCGNADPPATATGPTEAHTDHAAHAASAGDTQGDPHAMHTGAGGTDPHASHAAPKAHATSDIPLTSFPTAELRDQHGAQVDFRSDLIDDRLVAMNFIFTSCATICPPMGANFARLQTQMKDEGTDVSFVSVSIDPQRDTPARLKEWASRFDGDPAWKLVTGEPKVVDDLLKDLGVYSALREDHAPIVLLGNEKTGTWKRAYGLAAPDALADQLRTLKDPS